MITLVRQKLIVGIDPGVTTAVVMLGLDGRIVDAKSRKFFSFGDIISYISATGEPVIVSSDVNPPPRLVQRIASAFGARLHYPPEMITAIKKARMGRGLMRNDHERDAYAAALIAFEKFREDFGKIDTLAQGALADEAKNIFLKGAPSIKDAVDSANAAGNKEPDKDPGKMLEDRVKEIRVLRRTLDFYRKGKTVHAQRRDGPTAKELRLEKELLAAKLRASKAEGAVKSAGRIFRRLASGWIPAVVAADFRKDSLRVVEGYDLKDRWIIFLGNAGISRDVIGSLVSKGVQGVVCESNRLVAEFKTLSHLALPEADFDYAGSMAAINPSSMRTGIESVRKDFIDWARRVSNA
ncbi:MAG: DUF460 domain-containing protein [Candidatus Aenigmarchaeota archaeon]|nr:DUF460 domain-containing protein [Candidatus Aenigmarchaeota archaeon]